MKQLFLAIFIINQAIAGPCPDNGYEKIINFEDSLYWDAKCTDRSFPSKKEKGLRALWWNVEHNNTGKKLNRKYSENPLLDNLKQLIRDGNVDFLTLGEWKNDIADDELKKLIEENFEYSQYVPYSKEVPHTGIFILSKKKPKDIRITQLDWATNEEYRKEWQSLVDHTDYFERPFIQMTLNHKDKDIVLSPVHLNQPWTYYMNRELPKIRRTHQPITHVLSHDKVHSVIERLFNTVATASMIQFSKNSPLYNQIVEMGKVSGNSDVIFGDFNVPKHLVPVIKTGIYKKALGHLEDLATDQSPTFPTNSSNLGNRQVKIDQAFAKKELNASKARRLCLSGSDHYPITFDIN